VFSKQKKHQLKSQILKEKLDFALAQQQQDRFNESEIKPESDYD
jgi:hypothetical protein